MKKYYLAILITLFSMSVFSQSVGIGNTSPNATALLDLTSGTKGILIPRMLKENKLLIASPAKGLLIYQTGSDSVGFHYYDGSKWNWLQAGNNLDTLKWGTAGNAGTNAATHFIGTKDNVPLTFKINNQTAGKIDTSGSVSLGRGTLAYNPGFKRITAIGDSALYYNSFGSVSIFNGLDNTAMGEKTLFSNTTGSRNTAIGKQALYNSISDDDNTAIGYKAMENAKSDFSTAIGAMAANKLTTGDYSTAIGYNAASNTTTGAGITAVGYVAGSTNTTGTANTLVGFYSNVGNPSLTNATAIGAYTVVNTSNSLVLGNNANVGIGTSAPTEKLQVVGNIKTDGFILSSGAGTGKFLTSDAIGTASWNTVTRLYQITLPAQSFHPTTGFDADSRRFRSQYEVYAGNNGQMYPDGTYESVLEAPLIIPNGATITTIRFIVRDEHPNYELTGKLIARNHYVSSFSEIGSGSSGFSFDTGITNFDVPLNHVINTGTYNYVIQVYAQHATGRSAWGSVSPAFLSLRSVIVTYTMNL